MGYITGLCRAYTDYIITLDDDVELGRLGLAKGDDKLADHDVIQKCLGSYKGVYVPGGPVANSISVAAALGSASAYIGKVANDDAGKSFREAFEKSGIVFRSSNYQGNDKGSGLCVIFVTPDGARTVLFTRGVVDDVEEGDITPMSSVLEDTKIIFAGFSVRNSYEGSPFMQVRSKAPEALVATSLQSFNELSKEDVRSATQLILDRADIIFGNDIEYPVFLQATGYKTLEEISRARPEKIFSQTLGAAGALVVQNAVAHHIPIYPAKVIDTTGAGDAYAGGFLHGLNQGASLAEAGQMGAYCASQIISQIGGRPSSAFQPAFELKKVR